jgi:hypothetical protein
VTGQAQRRQVYGGSHLPWLWHALFDGTRLCRCPHSAWYAGGPGPVEHPDGTITYDGPPLPGPARRGTGAEGRW